MDSDSVRLLSDLQRKVIRLMKQPRYLHDGISKRHLQAASDVPDHNDLEDTENSAAIPIPLGLVEGIMPSNFSLL
jgi:hypothetical protein